MQHKMTILRGLQLMLVGIIAMVSMMASAVDFHLAAKAYDKTMPYGPSVPMWGYVEDAGGTCYNATTDALRLTCINGLPDPVSPGPRLSLLGGQSNLRIFLSNGLTEPTSVVITGQELPFSRNNNGPTWDDNSIGPRGNDPDKRVRSFGREAAANGGSQQYIWSVFQNTAPDRPGSFIYHSGTHPQKQVYMGMYGAMTKRAPNIGGPSPQVQQVYTGVPYDKEIMLFYSEIDPDLNAAIDAGTYSTSIFYHARWFLINGEPYVDGSTLDITADVGDVLLLRMFSTTGETHVPTLQGMYMTIHAEDGRPYTWQDGLTGLETAAPRQQYTAMLPPLKTKDAIVVPTAAGKFALYDGNGAMTNPSDNFDFVIGDEVGGMLRFLSVSTVVAQTPINDGDQAIGGIVGGVGSGINPGNTGNDQSISGKKSSPVTSGLDRQR